MRGGQRQQGYTLIEFLVAVAIGIFLLSGLLIIVQGNGRVYREQSSLVQLQDGQRLALTMLTDVIQSAGYFTNPLVNTAAGALPLVAPYATAGQPMYGTENAAAPGDTISVRYLTASGDGVLNCAGLSNATGANVLYVNTFSVTGGQLVCTVNGVSYPLVSGVTNMQVLYGVKTNLAAANSSADTYLNAAQMTTTNWMNVISVNVTLTFSNPLYAAGNNQPQTINLPTVITVMNRASVVL